MGTSPRGRRSTGAYEEGSGGGGVIYMSIARVAVIQDAKEKTSEVSGGAYRWEGVKTKQNKTKQRTSRDARQGCVRLRKLCT